MRVQCLCFNFLPDVIAREFSGHCIRCISFCIAPSLQHRINKRGSQKDMEQKKSGNYFFYDDGADDEDEEEEGFDDI
jgi:hypothetical protein